MLHKLDIFNILEASGIVPGIAFTFEKKLIL